jgi:hypothetical protein
MIRMEQLPRDDSARAMSIASWASDQNPREDNGHIRDFSGMVPGTSEMATSISTLHKSMDSFDAKLSHIDRNLRQSDDAGNEGIHHHSIDTINEDYETKLAYPNLVASAKPKSVDEFSGMPPPTNRPSHAQSETLPLVGGFKHRGSHSTISDSSFPFDFTAALERALEENDEGTIQTLLNQMALEDGHGTSHFPKEYHEPEDQQQHPSEYTSFDVQHPSEYTSFDMAAAQIDSAMRATSPASSSLAYPHLAIQQNSTQSPAIQLPTRYLAPQPIATGQTLNSGSGLSIDLFQSTESTVSMLSDTFSAMTIDQGTSLVTAVSDHDVVMDEASRCWIPLHAGNRRYEEALQFRHARYARSKSEGERLLLRQELIQCVTERGGRFVMQLSDCSYQQMDTIATEQRLMEDFGQKSFVDDVSIELDVRMGRGGHCTNDPGHQRFLDKKDEMRVAYKNAGTNIQIKGRIAQDLVDWVYDSGGRFLKEHNNQWYIVDNDVALHKAKQALRTARKKGAPVGSSAVERPE